MRDLELQVDTLMRLCTAETLTEQARAKRELKQLMEYPQLNRKDPEYLVRRILLEMGTPDHLVGHPYVVEAVLMAVENRYYINNITFGLYPQIAAKFDTTASRVERGIRHLIELTWTRGDMDILCSFFGNTVNPDRGKPTNGEFIARLTNIVQQQMKEAA
ncbi:MAG: sporulation initiation factor Spo0A C-terminal domain-containing protein [Eubacteriales bacterium]|nr:sporulation initiation factor Spo0A C-terminal domain-containing protein [Eubacteriales bacterium]